MDRETLQLLEFEQVLELVARNARSAAGRRTITRLKPSTSREWIERRQRQIAEVVGFLESGGARHSLALVDDAIDALATLKPHDSILNGDQLVALGAIADAAEVSRAGFSSEGFAEVEALLAPLDSCSRVSDEIEHCLDAEGSVLDRAQPGLRQARRGQKARREKIRRTLDSILGGPQARYLINEPYVTERSGRAVLPVRRESRTRLEGIVHGSSGSGATVFVEPMAVVELNNDLQLLLDEEDKLCRQVLARLSQLAREHFDALTGAVDALSLLDGLFAAAVFARRCDARPARLVEEETLCLEDARHPLLIESLGAESVVPISLELTSDEKALVISGPNTGGKTVALKTIGLLCLLSQSGIPVPARRFEAPIFAGIWADLGDHQSIAQKLSSYSAHVSRIVEIAKLANPPCLVLLDEAGRATDAESGAALAAATVKHFHSAGALVVVTTHHSQLKYLAASEPGMANAGVQLDPETLEPTYRVEMGVASTSSGLEIARQLGLPPTLLTAATELRHDSESRVEDFLRELREEMGVLQKQRHELSRRESEVQEQRRKLEQEDRRREAQLRKQFERDFRKLTAELRRQVKGLLGDIEDGEEVRRLKLQLDARQALLKEEFLQKMKSGRRESLQRSKAGETLEEGDRVSHRMWKEGRVIQLDRDRVVVDVSGKRVSVAPSELNRIAGPARSLPSNVRLEAAGSAEPELNIIGHRVEEALDRADRFLDRAVVGQLREVTIVHGFGTGTLRRALAGFLREHPQVSSFEHRGGATRVRVDS